MGVAFNIVSQTASAWLHLVLGGGGIHLLEYSLSPHLREPVPYADRQIATDGIYGEPK